jgi:hypothetical protein
MNEKGAALTEATGWKSLRTPQFQYLIHDDGRENLWDLEVDPGAYQDVSDSRAYREALAECRQLLLTRLLAMERPRERAWTY